MQTYQIPPQTHIGRVALQVADLDRAAHFYRDLLGFHQVRQEGSALYLSASGSEPWHIALHELARARPNTARTSGLFHVAVRFPDRRALARALRHLLEKRWPLQGASDHRVSEAIYLADPDGNGIEIYCDRPRAAWPRRDGQIAMTTDPLDVEDLLRAGSGANDPWSGAHPETDIGHIHLRVSDLERAEGFYGGVLGLEVTQRDYPGALFLSAGGYHHHLGVNIWAGAGVPSPPPDAVGLRAFSLDVPDHAALQTLVTRARDAHVRFAGWRAGGDRLGFALQDPDGITVEILVADEVLSPEQAADLESQVRAAM